MASPLDRDAASFRDPAGYVFKRDGRVFRAVDAATAEVLRDLSDSGVLDQLIDDGWVVPSSFVEEGQLHKELRNEHPGFTNFLEHEPIAPILYPAEWSISMLADAGILTLDIQLQLLNRGYALKDATAYNVQFVNGRPKFIDLPSIERPPRLDVWYALGQFGKMFTHPLLLRRYSGWDLRSYFLGELGGRDVTQVSRSLGHASRWLPRYLLDVTLPFLLHRRFDKSGLASRHVQRKGTKPDAQLINLGRLRKKLRKLADGYRPRSNWTGYASQCNYDTAALEHKRGLVKQYLATAKPGRVLDVGCNTGEFSYLAAKQGAETVAADADHDTVEMLYRRLRSEPARITPIVLDFCSPTPAIGYMNRERPSFLDRVKFDCLLALAIVHHLRVSGNLPIAAIRDMFACLTERDLVLEFVPTDDIMCRQLTQLRLEDYSDFSLESCRAVFGEVFEIVRENPIPGTSRTLMLLRKRKT